MLDASINNRAQIKEENLLLDFEMQYKVNDAELTKKILSAEIILLEKSLSDDLNLSSSVENMLESTSIQGLIDKRASITNAIRNIIKPASILTVYHLVNQKLYLAYKNRITLEEDSFIIKYHNSYEETLELNRDNSVICEVLKQVIEKEQKKNKKL